jgi:hypothetical protein
MRYEDASYLRKATQGELEESLVASEGDGGAGVININFNGEIISCYVMEY